MNLKFWTRKKGNDDGTSKKKQPKSAYKRKDLLIGAPLLFTLSGLEKTRPGIMPEPNMVHRIGVMKLFGVRDIALARTFIAVLRVVYPKADIIFFASEQNFHALQLMPNLSGSVCLISSSLTASMNKVKSCGTFDLWIDFGIWSRFEAIISQTANAVYKIGFRTEGEHRHFAYDRVTDYNKDIHIFDNFEKLFALLDITVIKPVIVESLGEANREKKTVVLNIFADSLSEKNRQWSLENWCSVANFLFSKGYRIVLVGDKKDVAEAEKLNELAGADIDIDFLVGRLTFTDTINLLKSASLLISIDSNLLHAAAMIGTETIALYGPTSATLSQPIGFQGLHIIASEQCTPCQMLYGDEGCLLESVECMNAISVEYLISKISEILKIEEEATANESAQ